MFCGSFIRVPEVQEMVIEAAKVLGAGCATMALAGAGVGIGMVFGSLISAVAPMVEQQ